MAIERPNSFHLMLSDDELALLRLLAEREGLNASDYLRRLLRQEASGNPRPVMMSPLQLAELLGANVDLIRSRETTPRAANEARTEAERPARRPAPKKRKKA
jgi:hypothetical protein